MQQAFRPTIIIGNWKMHKTIAEAKSFIKGLTEISRDSPAKIWLAVPFTAIQVSADQAHGTAIAIGAQNVHDREEGPFTGEISCRMVKEAGATFTLIGHSERRQHSYESNAIVNKKVKRALNDGLRPVVCIGETLEQHQDGIAREILQEQLTQSLKNVNCDELQKVIVAYEPVWAIGTNLAAAPKQAQEVHSFCREIVAQHWNLAAAENIVILYGGSVKPENAASLLEQKDIDGLLVGGSSLSLNSFSEIIKEAVNIKLHTSNSQNKNIS